jgi:hypothetical protein
LRRTSTKPHDSLRATLEDGMTDTFMALSLVQTSAKNERRFEMVFVDATGQKLTICLPVDVAADLVPVMQSLSAGPSSVPFTKMPKSTAVGSARHEQLVLVRFDDDPPYALNLDAAENLWRGVREEAEQVSHTKAPARQ